MEREENSLGGEHWYTNISENKVGYVHWVYLDLIKGYRVTIGGYNAPLKEHRENTEHDGWCGNLSSTGEQNLTLNSKAVLPSKTRDPSHHKRQSFKRALHTNGNVLLPCLAESRNMTCFRADHSRNAGGCEQLLWSRPSWGSVWVTILLHSRHLFEIVWYLLG